MMSESFGCCRCSGSHVCDSATLSRKENSGQSVDSFRPGISGDKVILL